MVCQACKSFQAQLALKDEELKEVGSKFATYKLKSKGRLAQLKQSITEELPDAESWQKERAALLIRLAESENELDHRQKEAEDLRSKLATKETELSDHSIRIRSLEEQLRSALDRRTSTDERRHPADLEEVLSRDLERMHSQMVYKDTRIMELNNTILDKERQILDLQEMCREQGQLVQAKSRAFQIVQQRFLEIDSRTTKEASTETDLSLAVMGRSSNFLSGSLSARKETSRTRSRESSSPGHAVVQLRPGERMSPPPADPSEDRSSFTTETTTLLDEADAELKGMAAAVSTPIEGKRKQRKKVTFDLTPQTAETPGLDTMDDEIAQAIIDLTAENDQLRRTIQEMESSISGELQTRIDQLEEEVEQVRREGRNQALKARAAAQGRIRDLEEKIAVMQQEQKDEVERLNANVETLRAGREWTLEENGRLLEQLAASKQKFKELREELDESNAECENLRTKLAKDRDVIVKLADDVDEAQRTANLLFEQKVSILDDVDRLKEAIEAQGEYIEVLEADVVIYEEHIGILRDSLGASKVENRKLIKSKAFETKLKALEQEKEQMTKRNNDERLRIKALSAKIRSLEEENVSMVARLEEAQTALSNMQRAGNRHRQEAPDVAELSSSDDECNTIRTQQNQLIESLTASLQENESKLRKYESLASEGCGQRIEEELRQQAAQSADREFALQRQITELRSENAQLQEKYRTALADCSDHEIRLREAEEELDKYRALADHQQKSLTASDAENQVANVDDVLEHLKQEIEEARDRIQHMECANFELERELKETKRESAIAESRMNETEDRLSKLIDEERHRLEEKQMEMDRILETGLSTENQLKNQISEMESLLHSLRVNLSEREEELTVAKDEARKCRTELEHAKLAMSEMEAVDKEVQALKQQLDMEKASLESEWTEVRSMLVEKERELALMNSRQEQTPSPTVNADELSHRVQQLEGSVTQMNAIIKQQNEKIEADKMEKRKLRAAVKMLQAEKKATSTAQTHVNVEKETNTEENEIERAVNVVRLENEQLRSQLNALAELCEEKDMEKIREEIKAILDAKDVDATKQDTVEQKVGLTGKVEHVKLDDSLEERYQMVLAEVESTRNELVRLRDDVARADEERNIAHERLQQAIEEQRQAKEIDKQNEEKCTALLSEFEAAIADAAEIQRIVKKLGEEKKELIAEMQQLEDANNIIKKQYERLVKEMVGLRATIVDLEQRVASKDENDNEAEKAVDLQWEVESLRALLNAARDDADRRQQELEELHRQNEVLNAEKYNLSEQLAAIATQQLALQHDDTNEGNGEGSCNDSEKPVVETLPPGLVSTADSEAVRERIKDQPEAVDRCSSDAGNTLIEDLPLTSTVALLEHEQNDQREHVTAAKEDEGHVSTDEQLIQNENALLHEQVTENWCVQENLFEDVHHLMILNNELETAVEALKGELWSLNGQLKASLADREDLSEKLCEMARLRENERDEARERERELEDQKEMAERSQRQAALAENESNRRLAEWQEKSAEMEARRQEVEAAYSLLTSYYQQLQEAYNALYARFCIAKADVSTETCVEADQRDDEEQCNLSKARLEVEHLKEELEARENELTRAKSQLEQLRALAVSELGSLRKVVQSVRNEEIARLRNAVMECIAETDTQLRRLYEHALTVLSTVERIQNTQYVDSMQAVKELLEEILKESERSCAITNDASLRSAICVATEELKEMRKVLEDTRKALNEQRTICSVLENKLQQAEAERENKDYTCELERLLETTQISLSRHIDKCQRLEAKLDALERCEEPQQDATDAVGGVCSQRTALVSGGSNATVSSTLGGGIANSVGCAQCRVVSATSHLQMAILAARLTTKSADNDALFRCNAELAHANVRLQNEVDELRAQLDDLSTIQFDNDRTAEATGPLSTLRVAGDSESAVVGQEDEGETSCGDWGWGESLKEIVHSGSGSTLSDTRIADIVEEAEKKENELPERTENIRSAGNEGNDLESFNAEGTERSHTQLGNYQEAGIQEGRLGNMQRHSDWLLQEEGKSTVEETVAVEVSKLNVQLKEMEKMYVKEKELREQLELRLNEMAFVDSSEQSRDTREQPVVGEIEGDGWSWNEQLEVSGIDIAEESPSTEADLECRRLNEIIVRIEEELRIAQQSLSDTSECSGSLRGIRENSESEHSRKKIREEFDHEEIELTAHVTDAEELAVSLRNEEENHLQHAAICGQKDARTLSLEEANNHLKRIETSLRRLLESLEKRLHASEDYGFKLEVKNGEHETTVTNLQVHLVDTVINQDDVNANARDPPQEERIEENGTDDGWMAVEKLRVELAELEREKIELAEKLLQVDVNRTEELQKLKEGYENELYSLREQKNRIENSHHELLERFSKLEEENATMETDINKLQERLLASEMKAKRSTETSEEDDYERTIMKMKEELALVQHRNETLSREIEMLNEKNCEKDSKLEELSERMEVANDALKEARNDLEVMKKQNGLLKDAECVLMETTDRYERRIKEVEAENEELISGVKELETKLSAAVVSEGEHCALIERLKLRLNDTEEELKIAQEKLEKRQTLVDVGVQSTGDDSDERQETLSSYEKMSTSGALAHTSDSAMVEVCVTADDEIHALREKQHALEEVQRNSQSILDQNEQLNSKVGRLEEECKKLSTERKQLLKRIKIMKTELNAYREEELAGRSRTSSSLTLVSSEATQPGRISLEQPADETTLLPTGSKFEMRKQHASLTSTSATVQQHSKIVGRFLVEENEMNLDETIRQLQMTSEERVRRRKSGFQGKQ